MYSAWSLLYLYSYYCFHIIIINSICQHRQEPLAPACVCIVLCLSHICVGLYAYCLGTFGPELMCKCCNLFFLLTHPLTYSPHSPSSHLPTLFQPPSHSPTLLTFTHPPLTHSLTHSSLTFFLYSTSPIYSLILPPLMLSPIHSPPHSLILSSLAFLLYSTSPPPHTLPHSLPLTLSLLIYFPPPLNPSTYSPLPSYPLTYLPHSPPYSLIPPSLTYLTLTPSPLFTYSSPTLSILTHPL